MVGKCIAPAPASADMYKAYPEARALGTASTAQRAACASSWHLGSLLAANACLSMPLDRCSQR